MEIQALLAAVLATLWFGPGVSALYKHGSMIAPCDSPLYCHGEILKEIQLARPFADSKTFVDLPTILPLDQVIANFHKLSKPLSNNTELHDFLKANFGSVDSDLEAVPADQLTTNPVFLDKITELWLKQYAEKIIEIWPKLTRKYAGHDKCDGCVDSFIKVMHWFVVAGGRFREIYYWDTYFIIEGLLKTGGVYTKIARGMIENMLDLVDKYGFVPNGTRVYYLNRSQPPLLSRIINMYIHYTGDYSILDRALPLLIKEHEFWTQNRTVEVHRDGKMHKLNHYAVENTEPRPESYREDYETANNQSYFSASGKAYPEKKPLNESEKRVLYQNLASAAESGWDFSSRWLKYPLDAVYDYFFPLRSLNTVEIVPVDLNSILYGVEADISDFLAHQGNKTEAARYAKLAAERSASMHALFWNATRYSYYDFNLTSQTQNVYIPVDPGTPVAQTQGAPEGYQLFASPAQFYPFWTGAVSDEIMNNSQTLNLTFQPIADLLSTQAGGIAATNIRTGQQWDQPNVWPPLQYIISVSYPILKSLLSVRKTFGDHPISNTTGNLALKVAQRYLDSTYCTWRETGGSTDADPRLPGLNTTDDGTIFEKYAENATNVAGGGGEYSTEEGFGWSNGVILWVIDTFGNQLTKPECD